MSSLDEMFNAGAIGSASVGVALTVIALVWIFVAPITGVFAKILFSVMVIGTFLAFLALVGENIKTKQGFLYVPLILACVALILAWVYNARSQENFSKIATFTIGVLSMIVIVVDSFLLTFPSIENQFL